MDVQWDQVPIESCDYYQVTINDAILRTQVVSADVYGTENYLAEGLEPGYPYMVCVKCFFFQKFGDDQCVGRSTGKLQSYSGRFILEDAVCG